MIPKVLISWVYFLTFLVFTLDVDTFFFVSSAVASSVVLAAFLAAAFLALFARAVLRAWAAAWRALNRSTRPSVSMIFSSPVKNGCEALEMCTLTSG